MRKITMAKAMWLAALILGFQFTVSAQMLLEDNFDYTAGALLTANGWTAHSSAGTQAITVNNGGLTYTGYPGSGVGNAALVDNNGEDVHRLFPAQSTGVVYVSFMANITTTAAGYFLHIGGDPIGTTFRGRVYMDGTNHFGLGVGSNAGTYATSTFTNGTTYVLVLKYQIVTGTNNDNVSLYIFDSTLPSSEPGTPAIGPLTDATQTDILPASVALRQFSSSQNVLIDGIRVGLTWADILPQASVPPTEQTHDFVFANVLTDQMDVAWTNGNGSRRVVKINTVNSFTPPADGTDPGANPVYAGSGEQVVYNGAGSSFQVTGLTTSTTYWFQAWEYNGTGTGTFYCTASGLNNPLSQSTAGAASAPLMGAPSVTGITATSATLGGEILATGGAPILERGTVWSLTSPVTASDNKLAEGGTATGVFSHLRSGMPVNSTIYYAAYATNSAGTSLTAESSFTTLFGEPTNQADAFAANSGTYSSITNTWLDNDGAQPATGFLILANTTGIFTDPVDGVQAASDVNLGDGSGLAYVNHGLQTFTWTGLTSSTPYYFAIYAYTNSGSNIDYKIASPVAPTANVTTLAFVPPVAAWTFDATAASPNTPVTEPANFGIQSGTAMLYADGTNGSSAWSQSTELSAFGGTTINDPREGGAILAGMSYCPLSPSNHSSNGKSMVIKFSMSALQDPILTYATRYSSSLAFTSHLWEWSTDGTNFTAFGTNTGPSSESFVSKTIDMSSIDGLDGASTVYLRVTIDGATNTTGTSNNRLDNIVIRASNASTLPPTVATAAATDVTATEATLHGTVNANNQTSAIFFEYGLSPGTYGTPVPGLPPIVTGGSVISVAAGLTGLGQNTTYYYRVLASNASGTTYGDELTFTTGCLPTGAAGTISGPATIYADGVTAYVFSVPPVDNAANYIWSFPLPSEIISGEGTNTVSVVFNGTAPSGLVTVFATNACDEEGDASSMQVTLFAVPGTRSVNGTVQAGEANCYDATQTITVAGGGQTFEILANGSAAFKAGQNIIFLPSTIVHTGGYLLGTIVPNGPYCSGDAPARPMSVSQVTGSIDATRFRVYPNPTSGEFTVEMLNSLPAEGARVEVYGMLGGKVLTVPMKDRLENISIRGNHPGIYLVRITSGEEVRTVKIILTH